MKALSISQQEFKRRRQLLMAQMGENSLAILPSAPIRIRNRDVEYPYRQDSDFYYLSGFTEADSVMVLIPNRKHGEYILFCQERDLTQELWHGRRYGPEGVCKYFGADDAFPINDIDDILPGLIEGRERLYYAMGCYPEFDRSILNWVNQIKAKARSGSHSPGEFVALDHLLHEQRLIKSAHEIKLMRRAAEITAKAHIRAISTCQPGMYEFQLESEILHEFMMEGSRSHAYPSIVAGGDNACVLHYNDNAMKLKKSDLVLIDAGCEFDLYASDVTRTFPVSGKFKPAQKALYQIVLDAQIAALEFVKPGCHWNEPHEAAVRVITKGLIDLGIIKASLKRAIAKELYRPFYMHRTGHWLGMDVHDVGEYKVNDKWRIFEPGMVLTVEPGIYISPDYPCASKWQGIGIRIEDDAVVTKSGHDILSIGAPKTIADIEALR